MARTQEAEEKAQKKALMQGNASKNSATSRPISSLSRSSASTGRPMSGASRMSGFSVDIMTATPIHTSKRIPKKVHATPTSENFYFSLLYGPLLADNITNQASVATCCDL
jgi:hypothetical protein